MCMCDACHAFLDSSSASPWDILCMFLLCPASPVQIDLFSFLHILLLHGAQFASAWCQHFICLPRIFQYSIVHYGKPTFSDAFKVQIVLKYNLFLTRKEHYLNANFSKRTEQIYTKSNKGTSLSKVLLSCLAWCDSIQPFFSILRSKWPYGS